MGLMEFKSGNPQQKLPNRSPTADCYSILFLQVLYAFKNLFIKILILIPFTQEHINITFIFSFGEIPCTYVVSFYRVKIKVQQQTKKNYEQYLVYIRRKTNNHLLPHSSFSCWYLNYIYSKGFIGDSVEQGGRKWLEWILHTAHIFIYLCVYCSHNQDKTYFAYYTMSIF